MLCESRIHSSAPRCGKEVVEPCPKSVQHHIRGDELRPGSWQEGQESVERWFSHALLAHRRSVQPYPCLNTSHCLSLVYLENESRCVHSSREP